MWPARLFLIPSTILFLLFLYILNISAAQPPLPLPQNGSFEQLDAYTGLPAGWTPWNTARNLAFYTLAIARTGIASASLTDDSHTDSQGLRSPRVSIQGGKKYRAIGYVWITELQSGSFAIYLEFWKGPERLAHYSVSSNEKGRWIELKLEHIAPPEATEATILIYASSATVGHAYFDDIGLTGPLP